MDNYCDYKKVARYNTYIKNIKWTFNFMKEKIVATTELEYKIYDSRLISKEVCDYRTYKECFLDIIEEVRKLNLCRKCNRLDDTFCKRCEIGEMIDKITLSDMNENEECPICYKTLSLRYTSICDDERHKICSSCYDSIRPGDVLCPLCRQVSEGY